MRVTISGIVVALVLGCGQSSVEDRQPPCQTDEDCRAFGPSYANHICNDDHRCFVDRCGDGRVQAGEECDDGNPFDNDACLTNCKTARCSDGQVQAGVEECDDADRDNTNGCTNLCRLPTCGDGFSQPGEQCDDGNSVAGDDCTNECFAPTCGDGVRRRYTNGPDGPVELTADDDGYEACDDGNTVDTDDCTSGCRAAVCGDGYVRTSLEECDDANTIAGDGCSDNCLSEVCGNGRIDSGESCDDGNRVDNDECTNACAPAGCGDGVTSVREECDDGNLTGGDGCSSTCLTERCGNGRVDPEAGEQCDDGDEDSTDVCTSDCQQARCGDGFQQLGVEACDDGNLDDTDACVSGCRLARCGDGFQQAGIEACDDGNLNNSDQCTTDCRVAACGDGYVRQGLNPGDPGYEACDDANQNNTDSCTNRCQLAACGDGHLHLGVEQCDDGNQDNDDACVENCRSARCGDAFTRAGVEDCDDGNDINTDSCTTLCLGAKCGDGYVRQGLQPDEPGYEQCDDGNLIDSDNCTTACQSARCGDNIIQIGEECDDGNEISTDDCTNVCRLARCGDGVTQEGRGEACDDANLSNADACTNDCQLAVCGDGYVRAGLEPGDDGYEACDDGNNDQTDACVSECRLPSCGDGFVQNGVEQCDDGNQIQTDDCTTACTVARCGDGHVQAGNGETCDDGNRNAQDACTNTCVAATCGDGRRRLDLTEGQDGYEACDDGNRDNADSCTTECKTPRCGDGYHQPGNNEQCDDGNLDETDTCLATCRTARCGDGEVRAGAEACDDGNRSNDDGCTNFCAEARCGDRIVRHDLVDLADSQYEECDDGNLDDDDGCTNACRRPVLDVTMGDEHACAIRYDNKVACFGTNTFSQSGYPSVSTGEPVLPAVVREQPEQGEIGHLADVVSIAAGPNRTCAIKRSGAVACWGGDNTNQPGLGRADDQSKRAAAKEIPGFSGIAEIAAGTEHTCAIDNAGTIWCWGKNSYKQQGAGDSETHNCQGEARAQNDPQAGSYVAEPRVVRALGEMRGRNNVPSISASWRDTCAVISGSVWCWGNYRGNRGASFGSTVSAGATTMTVSSDCPSVVPEIVSAVEVATGNYSSCARLEDGSLWCWGSNAKGQLGRGDMSPSIRAPGAVSNIDDALDIVAGEEHFCALLGDRTVSCWGDNSSGQIGDGTRVQRSVPTAVAGLIDVMKLTANGDSTCAIDRAGRLKCWGRASTGQLGDGRVTTTSNPLRVNRTQDATALIGANDHICAEMNSDTVRCWGGNSSGQLGDGSRSASNVPLQVGGIIRSNFNGNPIFAASYDSTCSSTTFGGSDRVSCWGKDHDGTTQLSRTISTPLSAPFNGVEKITFGHEHGCLVQNETIKCWGSNSTGQLGRPGANSATPVATTFNYPGVDVAAHFKASCGVFTIQGLGNYAYCWGSRDNYLLGDGSRVGSSSTPRYVAGTRGASSISVGRYTACVVLDNGQVKCWGNGNLTPLGSNENNVYRSRTVVRRSGDSYPALTGVTQVAIGWQHTCARTSEGYVYCWGRPTYGVLGIRDHVSGLYAQRVKRRVQGRLVDLSNATAVAAGLWYSCALIDGQSVVCWGRDSYGQLGQEDAPPFYSEPRSVVPLYDDRVYSRVIEVQRPTYNAGEQVRLTGQGFEPFSSVQTELVSRQGVTQVVDSLDVGRDGRVVSTFDLANNTASGTYTVRVREIGSNVLNPVEIEVIAAATPINRLPASIGGLLQAGAENWYVYTPSDTETVRIQTTGSTDTFCELRAAGRLVASDDDSGDNNNCQIDSELDANTEYRIKVRHYREAGTGAYTLSVVVQ